MKEFNNNMVISFKYGEKTFTHLIDADQISIDKRNKTWHHSFESQNEPFTVYGSIDTDGDIRTSGPINKQGTIAFFYVEADNTMGTLDDVIDDVDIIATDVPVKKGVMYINVRIEYAYDAKLDEEEAQRQIMENADYQFSLTENHPVHITDTEICGQQI